MSSSGPTREMCSLAEATWLILVLAKEECILTKWVSVLAHTKSSTPKELTLNLIHEVIDRRTQERIVLMSKS